MIGGDEDFEDSVHAKVSDHSHLAVNIDLVHRNGDHIATSLGELKKSSIANPPQFLKSKDKGDREFLDEIEYLNSLTDLVSLTQINLKIIINKFNDSFRFQIWKQNQHSSIFVYQ